MAFSPMVTLGRMVAPDPMEAPCLTTGRLNGPVLLGLKPRFPFVALGYLSLIKVTLWPIKTSVLNDHTLADEGVARDLAVLPDPGVLLDLDKGADLGIVTHLTPVEVDELEDFNVLAKLNIGCNRYKFHQNPHKNWTEDYRTED